MSKIITVAALVLCLAAFAPLASAAPTSNSLAIPVTGTGSAGALNGVFTLTGFAVQNGSVVATGILTGTVTSASGVVTSILQTVTAAVTLPNGGACNILNLTLGPINLNLLGLQITTNQIVVNITAISGPGNLLGNLLCDVANLLNNPSQLANLLNQVVGILRGL